MVHIFQMLRQADGSVVHQTNDWRQIVIYDDMYRYVPRISDLLTSICIDHTENKSTAVTVHVVINGRVHCAFHVLPGEFHVSEMATAPIRHASHMSLGLVVKSDMILPKIYLRTSHCYPRSETVLSEVYAETYWFSRYHSTYARVRADHVEETYIEDDQVRHICSVADLRDALARLTRAEQRAPFYKWVNIEHLAADDWPDVASSCCIFNITAQTVMLTCSHVHHSHEYVVVPGVNVFELFWTEVYRPKPSQLLFQYPGPRLTIFLRVGWFPDRQHDSYVNTPVLVAPTAHSAGFNLFESSSGRWLQHICSESTIRSIMGWLFVSKHLPIFQNHPLYDSRLRLLVGNYVGNCF